ncbi:hypothetical protein PLIP_a0288 [Pseudoalteromonas lipolytica LMEB 39]|nr:hypothetical protein [Pseudoalteromonas lipolytica LMEB 39]
MTNTNCFITHNVKEHLCTKAGENTLNLQGNELNYINIYAI